MKNHLKIYFLKPHFCTLEPHMNGIKGTHFIEMLNPRFVAKYVLMAYFNY